MIQARRTHFELKAAMRVLKLKLKQKDLVKACGVDRVSVSRWLNGSRTIPHYVWTILTFIHVYGREYLAHILNGETFQWPIIRENVTVKIRPNWTNRVCEDMLMSSKILFIALLMMDMSVLIDFRLD